MAIEQIFGYGSLIWKPPPFVTGRIPCYVKGYTRRFAQFSHDHRGTTENPGVVVTLVPDSEWLELTSADKYPSRLVWGVMYTIDPSHAEEVQAYLDEREKDGYELMEVDVFVIKDGREQCHGKSSIYVGHVTNPSFCRLTKMEELASRIHKSVGPSGPNKEYLYHLKQEVEALCPEANDPYLRDLEGLVKQLDQTSSLA
ncbi:hypothetical protein PTTG_25837 [Puccinia triticina 1-1 BBBD Race 1]|uniref:glutathione-specific gamma-glutamylcyclotransferase n=1 Tax=Puccinia triticina (isolate 1-1 / race 1 (BBBD)) TaxID=630390 RepID=A0A180GYL4_PUCT1|nr:hypothetical protein PTTG_25837 [Puccinia triticina 1-1 BBBD Race 1]